MRKALLVAASFSLATLAGAQTAKDAQPASNVLQAHTDADVVQPSEVTTYVTPTIISQDTFAGTTTMVVDIAGTDSWDLLGDSDNIVLTVPLTTGDMMTGIGWDVTLMTVGGSWLSEARFYFDGSDQDLSGLFLTPGVGLSTPGTSFFSSGGIVDLTDNGIPDIPILADGTLYIEVHETFDDVADAVDSTWIAPSTLTLALDLAAPAVPTVNQWGLIILTVLLFAGIVWRSVRRKSAPNAG